MTLRIPGFVKKLDDLRMGGAIDKPDEIVRLGTAKDEGITINVDIIAKIVMVRTKQGDSSEAPTLTR